MINCKISHSHNSKIGDCTMIIKEAFYVLKYIYKEEYYMTVITKLKQTIAGLKSAQACLEGFVLDTDNKQA